MSEQISTEILKAMNEIADNENTAAKIDASIFIRDSQRIINEKVACLYNMLKVEAKYCGQRQDNYFDDVELIITHFKQKLNMVYDEFYCQYVNIQNEIQEARSNRRIAIINFQKIVNDIEKNPETKTQFENAKKELIKKNEIYKEIIQKCDLKFSKSKEEFEKMINEQFTITSKSLQIISHQNIFKRMFGRFSNMFKGGKKYLEILKQYNKTVNDIDSHEIVQQMRNDTIEFVADILEMMGIEENGLESVRIGGKNGSK